MNTSTSLFVASLAPVKTIVAFTLVVLVLAAPRASGIWIVTDLENLAKNIAIVEQQMQQIQHLQRQVELYEKQIKRWDWTDITTTTRRMKRMMNDLQNARQRIGNVFERFPVEWELPDPDVLLQQREVWARTQRERTEEAIAVQASVEESAAEVADQVSRYVDESNAAAGPLAAQQAGNEMLAVLIAQVQEQQALEVAALRAEIERAAEAQAVEGFQRAYRERSLEAVAEPPGSGAPVVDLFAGDP